MRVTVSWLRELVEIPAGDGAEVIGEHLVRAGLEIEEIERIGDVKGPVVIGRVDSFVDEPQKNGKTIRWCVVNVGPDHGGERGVVCGASNFAAGDHVVVALPGAELPGGFVITARKTYGHVSDGMICSARELGLGEDHDGIMVLGPHAPVGAEAISVLGSADEVLDLAVTPDRGYCFSMRGVAREVAIAYNSVFHDPAFEPVDPDDSSDMAREAVIEDPAGADRLVIRTLEGFDPAASSPLWMRRRLTMSGMRPISLAVDVTNYVMLLTGQPLHAFDADKVQGAIRIRRAVAQEKLTTLDGTQRTLDSDDLVIADDTGAIALAGTMGGASTEVDAGTTRILLEAAHFDAICVARQSRRHRLSSEASRRFERGADPALPPAASALAVRLLAEHGGAALVGTHEVDLRSSAPAITIEVSRPGRTAGTPIEADEVVAHLRSVGCDVEQSGTQLNVRPPSWRADLTDPADLDEEVIRLFGYDNVPSRLPRLPSARGLIASQRTRRAIARVLADTGHTEVLSYPFVGEAELDALLIDADDPRRSVVTLANPISDEQPMLRTTLLPGLLAILKRNLGRGADDVALFEMGAAYHWALGHQVLRGEAVPRPAVLHRPSAAELQALDASLPYEERRVAVVMAGRRERAGWWGPGREAMWSDAVESARIVAAAAGAHLVISAESATPWHPGRCATFRLADGTFVGHAGELHPRVCENLGLPARTCAMELILDRLIPADRSVVPAPAVSSFPVAKEDLALVVADEIPVSAVEAALREGAGPLLESIRLFDVYTGPQVGQGARSLAFALRFRAADRTLEVGEVAAARDAALANATQRVGAALRS